MGGSSKPPTGANIHQYGGMGQADTGAMSGINQMAQGPNYAGQLYSQYGAGLGNMLNATNYNPQSTVGAGNFMTNQGTGMYGIGDVLSAMGLDPQQSYYNQAFQQQQEQTRAGEAARGLAMTPVGQAMESQANQQFNNLWRNQQAQRAAQLSGAAQGMYGMGAQNVMGGQGLSSGATMQQLQMLQGLQQAGMGAYAQQQQAVQDYLSYMSGGTQAAKAKTDAEMAAYQANQQSSQQTGQAIGSAAMMAMMMFSDERVKEDITQVGELYDGMPVYRFRYVGDPVWRIGLMAQDVEQEYPEAVGEVDGVKMVDYFKATETAAYIGADEGSDI